MIIDGLTAEDQERTEAQRASALAFVKELVYTNSITKRDGIIMLNERQYAVWLWRWERLDEDAAKAQFQRLVRSPGQFIEKVDGELFLGVKKPRKYNMDESLTKTITQTRGGQGPLDLSADAGAFFADANPKRGLASAVQGLAGTSDLLLAKQIADAMPAGPNASSLPPRRVVAPQAQRGLRRATPLVDTIIEHDVDEEDLTNVLDPLAPQHLESQVSRPGTDSQTRKRGKHRPDDLSVLELGDSFDNDPAVVAAPGGHGNGGGRKDSDDVFAGSKSSPAQFITMKRNLVKLVKQKADSFKVALAE